MKCRIFSTSSLALIISLTIIATSNFNIAFAEEGYLKLKSVDVDYHDGDLDVDIQTENIPSEKGKRGFGYGVLTDVGDEFVNNVLVAISDIGIQVMISQLKTINYIHMCLILQVISLGLVVVRTMKLPRVPQTMTHLIPSILLM